MNCKKTVKNIIITLTAVTTTTHLINKVISYYSNNNYKSNSNTSRYKWRFGEIHYTKRGSGTPILLIHSLDPCCSDYEWHSIVDNLALTNTVYTLDLIGCGKSDKPNMTYTNFLYVQLLSDFIKDVIQEKTDIIVSSTATPIVIMTTQYDKDAINRIIISSPVDITTCSIAPTQLKKCCKTLINIPIYGTLAYNIILSKKAIYNRFVEQYYSDIYEIEDNTINEFYLNSHYQNSKGKYLYSSIIANYTNINIINTLSNINNSIYIICGNDTPNYLTISENYKKYNSSIEIFTIPGAQLSHLEYPTKYLEQIKIILDI